MTHQQNDSLAMSIMKFVNFIFIKRQKFRIRLCSFGQPFGRCGTGFRFFIDTPPGQVFDTETMWDDSRNMEVACLYHQNINRSYRVKWNKLSNVPFESKSLTIPKSDPMIIFSSTSIPIDCDTRIILPECASQNGWTMIFAVKKSCNKSHAC